MKSAIIYYSFTGNTHRIARLIIEILKNKNEEAIPVRIRPLKEEIGFLKQCKKAFFGEKPAIYRTLLDLKDFDRVILGSPVWAFKPVPAINTYLDKCSSLEGKKALVFVTYGSGVGKNKTLEIMKKGLETKGAQGVRTVSFQQSEDVKETRDKLSKLL